LSDIYRIEEEEEEKEIENGRRTRNTTSIIVCSAQREKENEKYCLNIIVLSSMYTVCVENGRRKKMRERKKK
jgi:hypothetical protein